MPRRPGGIDASRVALGVALLALVLSSTGIAQAVGHAVRHAAGAVFLGSDGKIPRQLLPKVARAANADRVGGMSAPQLSAHCGGDAIDIGTWCLMSGTVVVAGADIGHNDYFYASRKCAQLGGWLPSAAQLIGAANRVSLNSTLTDDPTTASVDSDPSHGLHDKREMSSTLVTTSAGSSAAGSEGVSPGSTGDPRAGQPDPTPQPADPAPDTLQYVTVYSNHQHGGFAGSEPVSHPEAFRCAFAKKQGDTTISAG